MANTRYCAACVAGHPSKCQARFQAPPRPWFAQGSQPKRLLYSYKCPNRAMSPFASGGVVKL